MRRPRKGRWIRVEHVVHVEIAVVDAFERHAGQALRDGGSAGACEVRAAGLARRAGYAQCRKKEEEGVASASASETESKLEARATSERRDIVLDREHT